MKTFKRYLEEALDRPFEYEKSDEYDTRDREIHRYTFRDDKNHLTHVYFSHHIISDPTRASVDFTDGQGNFDATGKGSIRHLSTVKKIMQDHAKAHPHLKKFSFTGEKTPGKKDGGGRDRLYKRLVKMAGGTSQDRETATQHYIPINRNRNGD